MKTEPNHGAFASQSENDIQEGLTKREYFASELWSNSTESFNSDTAKAIMGSEPPKDRLENFKWWVALEAKIAVMNADALIAELNKEETK